MTKSRTINAQTELYGIIGKPVGHSLSPVMHNAAFEHLGMNAVYLAFETDDTDAASRAMRCLGIRGYSVTIPNKESIIRYLDEPDDTVIKIGACNTVRNRDGRLQGTNTDWIGAIKALERITSLAGKRAVVLGAGGSARAIIYGLIRSGVHVTVCNRTIEKAQRLSEEFGCTPLALEEAERLSGHILINTTSVGMGKLQDDSPLSKKGVENYDIVMDIVYAPLETKLLGYASSLGKKVVNGLEMLLLQATAQFEFWTGQPAPEQVMKKALEDAVRQSN
ncbi:MAG: shikimate dehydrogenase [Thermodesulfobacteria bacterium]|nr:shikimate dehydrogenase [Thermodesulfobacteriota bacterium]